MAGAADIHPMHLRALLTILVSVPLAACAIEAPAPVLEARDVDSPAGPDSGEPFVFVSGNGLYLSWLERAEHGGHDLLFAHLGDGVWSAPRTVASSERFLVNWADFPSITTGPDGALWAHWLERGETGGYDYGVRISRSADEGTTWSLPWTPHDDGTPTEHGFVSSMPMNGGKGYVWLDGRGYAPTVGGADPATEEMALYFRVMGADGPASGEVRMDARVCDCCQTDAALTAAGPAVVYRDRSPDEVRDIYITRWTGGVWSPGAPVHADGWETGACPVNGPAIAAQGDQVAVAWFTAAEGIPRVKVAFSTDSGAHFGEPTLVDSGDPAGRVDLLMLEDGSVLVSWLERTGGEWAEVLVRYVSPNGQAGEPLSVSRATSERASGFPRIGSLPGGGALVAWTDVAGPAPRVRLAAIEVTPK